MSESPTPSVFDAEPGPRSPKAANRQARRAERATKKAGLAPSHRPLVAKTKRQATYIADLRAGDSVFAVGGAGTGKTYIAARIAAQKLVKGEIERIIVCRVTVSKPKHALGFLPGKLEAKIAPWLIPVMDGLKAEVSSATIEAWKAAEKFEIASFEHMRGRTFANAFIILDEAQNADFGDLKLFLTRTGEDSQVVVTGDLDQIDVRDSGLDAILDICEDDDLPMSIIEFTEEDVVRSPFAKAWVKAFARRRPTDANLDSRRPFRDDATLPKAA